MTDKIDTSAKAVAAAYEAAAKAATEAPVFHEDDSVGKTAHAVMCLSVVECTLRALTPADARAALEARDARIRAKEREWCARIAESAGPRIEWDTPPEDQAHAHYCVKIAAAIRAGGE